MVEARIRRPLRILFDATRRHRPLHADGTKEGPARDWRFRRVGILVHRHDRRDYLHMASHGNSRSMETLWRRIQECDQRRHTWSADEVAVASMIEHRT